MSTIVSSSDICPSKAGMTGWYPATTFTAGAQNTLPIWILGKIRLGQQLPEVNAVVFVVVVLTIIPVVISQRLTQESGILRRE